MRAGGCTVQQTLTAEAAGVVKHAVALARRRGHAQVTPLHVAATLLAPGASVLRRACMKSHPHSTSHPLQCRALELCFNVALNRLPTAAGPLVQGQPSLSNALVAALKRAQAHQRRGCLEQQQQQPLLAVKVEMEQLIISILDDPSVSRVMREAGFSSTFVKNNLEETVAVFPSFDPKIKTVSDHAEMRTPSSSSSLLYTNAGIAMNMNYNFLGLDNSSSIMSRISSGNTKNEDIASVMKVLLGKGTRRNPVIVGDCLLSTENVVRELMIRVERGDVPEPLRTVRFVSPQFSSLSLRLLSRDDVEHKLTELRRTINSCLAGGSAIIYAGDLRWAADRDEKVDGFYSNNNKSGASNGYCPVEHIIMELGRILVSYSESRRLWLMATATYQTFMRCQMRQPSLETLWGLHAAPIPSGGLSLTLQASSTESRANDTGSEVLVADPQNFRWPMPALKTVSSDDDLEYKLNCCSECSTNFEREAQILREQDHKSTETMASSDQKLPFWLQQCKNTDNISRETDAAAEVELNTRRLRRKWNQTCRTKHSQYYTGTGTTDDPVQLLSSHRFESAEHSKQHAPAALVPPVSIPWWSTPPNQPFVPASRSQSVPVLSAPWINSTHQLSWSTGAENCQDMNPNTQDSIARTDVKTVLALGLAQATKANDESDNCAALAPPRTFKWPPCSPPESVISMGNERRPRFWQSDTESLKGFCKRLSEQLPWQSEESIHAIASTVLKCRSGLLRRQGNLNIKRDAWLLLLGSDKVGKRNIAKALAETIFGSQDKVVSVTICAQNSPNLRSHQEGEIDYSLRGKTYVDRLAEAVISNPHNVVLLEEIEQADNYLMAAIVNAMERGKLMDSNGREVSLSEAIILITSSIGSSKYFMNSTKGLQLDEEKLRARNGRYGLRLEVKDMDGVTVLRSSPAFSLKRKAEWDHDHMQESHSLDQQKRNRKSLLVALDLNLQAQDPAELLADHEQDGSMSGNSDVSQETLRPLQKDSTLRDQILSCSRERFSGQFFNFLDNCIVLQPFDFGRLAEFLLDKLESSYTRGTNGRGSLEVESSALEEMVRSCWEMGTQGFEKWVEEIFEAGLAKMLSMHTVTSQTIVKLSSVADINGDSCFYANSNLPARLEVDLNVDEE